MYSRGLCQNLVQFRFPFVLSQDFEPQDLIFHLKPEFSPVPGFRLPCTDVEHLADVTRLGVVLQVDALGLDHVNTFVISVGILALSLQG